MKILLVEDDAATAAYIRRGLMEHGHSVDCAGDGHEGLMLATGGQYEAMVLDRMLPKLDGLSLLKVLRAGGTVTPALLLTALGGLEDKVQGLEAGADDYLVKPFAFAELHARLQALVRRPALQPTGMLLRAGDLVLDRMDRSARRGAQIMDLQPTEFRLLEVLMLHAGQAVTRTMLLEKVWDFHFDPRTSIVETHISRLRAKLNSGGLRDRILTVRGAGYKMDTTP